MKSVWKWKKCLYFFDMILTNDIRMLFAFNSIDNDFDKMINVWLFDWLIILACISLVNWLMKWIWYQHDLKRK